MTTQPNDDPQRDPSNEEDDSRTNPESGATVDATELLGSPYAVLATWTLNDEKHRSR